ncbi:MAG: GGDEF domain-containing protein [Caldilineaceae bacterium]
MQQYNILGRLGGEEFALLLPETPDAAALQVGELACKVCKTTPILVNEQSLSLTVSVGVASRSSTDRSFAQMLERADQYMYLAKNNGGNRVIATHIPQTSLAA